MTTSNDTNLMESIGKESCDVTSFHFQVKSVMSIKKLAIERKLII